MVEFKAGDYLTKGRYRWVLNHMGVDVGYWWVEQQWSNRRGEWHSVSGLRERICPSSFIERGWEHTRVVKDEGGCKVEGCTFKKFWKDYVTTADGMRYYVKASVFKHPNDEFKDPNNVCNHTATCQHCIDSANATQHKSGVCMVNGEQPHRFSWYTAMGYGGSESKDDAPSTPKLPDLPEPPVGEPWFAWELWARWVRETYADIKMCPGNPFGMKFSNEQFRRWIVEEAENKRVRDHLVGVATDAMLELTGKRPSGKGGAK